MPKSVAIAILVFLLTESGCASLSSNGRAVQGGSRDKFAATPNAPTLFSLQVEIAGLIALVQKPQASPNRMWALLPYTEKAGGVPKGCQSQALSEKHYAAVRVKTKYLSSDPSANGDQLAMFYINGRDLTTNALSAGICKRTSFSFDDSKHIAKMRDFATAYSTPCSDCTTDNPAQVATGLVAGRILIDNATPSLKSPIQYKSSDVDWCFPDAPGGNCNAEYKPLDEQLEWIQTNCSLAPGNPLVLSFGQGAKAEQLSLYPKDSGGGVFLIEFEVVNLSLDEGLDLFTPLAQIMHDPKPTIDHFAGFYELAGDPTISKPCPIPETKDIPVTAAGKPYCPLVELDPVN
jgi:hypothetical protein